MGEFGLIARITADLAAASDTRIVVGPGDDAAVLAIGAGRAAVSVDVLIEGRHFRRDWSSARQIGAKAAAASLADLAAMGAAPVALVVGFGAPAQLPAQWAVECAAGVEVEAASAGAHVVGGDVTASDMVMLSVTGIGDLQGRPPVLRSGAKPGDTVAICGRLGWSAAGLDLLRAGRSHPAALIADHQSPQPPYSAGTSAALAGASAMIDLSDGLVADARHIADASGVRIELSLAAALAHPATNIALLMEAARSLHPADSASAMVSDWVLQGGEDHGLLACFPYTVPEEFTVIGSVQSGMGVWVDGSPATQRGGHEHFRA